jgi:gliding motility-associated-like protein
MKWILTLLLCSFFAIPALARHGKGGSIAYEYLSQGSGTGTSRYRITVKHYIDCDGEQFTETKVFLGIFDAGTNTLLKTLTIDSTASTTIQKTSFNACIYPRPEVCYFVVSYVAVTELPNNAAGYVLTEQECCRINGIVNIQSSGITGITITNTIPGIINGLVYRQNSSPVYAQRDTAVICRSSYFEIDFSATDEDGDKLTYAFCSGKAGGTAQTRQPNPPAAPPYTDLSYIAGFAPVAPLGGGVSLDAQTGLISGTAPANNGSYIIAVCVSEFRSGILIGTTKKEVQITVADCSLQAAALKPYYINCDDYSFTFQNEAFSSSADNYQWDFGVPDHATDVSTAPSPAFTYPDTGTYVLKLRVSTASGCEDSTTSAVRVYPGFQPGFAAIGNCIQTPFGFTDTTSARYGTVNSWLWDFGDAATTADVSTIANPTYQYQTTGNYAVRLMVGSSTGCADTVTKTIVVRDKPPLQLPFRDTLICSIDTLQLLAYGTGAFSWSPNSTMLNANTATPLVYPKNTTTYKLTLDENGCVAEDSITVNVLDFITVQLPADTTICKGDNFQLTPVSQALQYQWTPATGLSDPFTKAPIASPVADIQYQLTARLGRCEDNASINVKVAPYPVAAAGRDTVVCNGTSAQLNGAVTASSFTWTPAASLAAANTVRPVATPAQTTAYVLTAANTSGCPKPVRDTVVVTVPPRIVAFAGNDTAIVAGQPLQLLASGGASYQWTPGTGLSSTTIANPVVTLNGSTDLITYVVTASVEGCAAQDSVTVRVFKTGAAIFVPTAFTPNGDGQNDVLLPVAVGLKSFEYFRIYNRWGQLIFSTNRTGTGWDGAVHGQEQATGVFVFMAQGIDYAGNKIFTKGTFTLIR